MIVDFEIKGWERIEVMCDDQQKEEIREAIESGKIQTGNSLVDFLDEREIDWELEPLIPESETYLGAIEIDNEPVKVKS